MYYPCLVSYLSLKPPLCAMMLCEWLNGSCLHAIENNVQLNNIYIFHRFMILETNELNHLHNAQYFCVHRR